MPADVLLRSVPGLEEAWRAHATRDPAAIPVRAAPWWLPHIRAGRYSAIALPWGIYVQSAALRRDPGALAALITHELVHMEQWRRLGAVRFLWRYASGYVRGRLAGADGRTAYREVDVEVEAREIAERVIGSR